jgi:chromosome segregation ATPase
MNKAAISILVLQTLLLSCGITNNNSQKNTTGKLDSLRIEVSKVDEQIHQLETLESKSKKRLRILEDKKIRKEIEYNNADKKREEYHNKIQTYISKIEICSKTEESEFDKKFKKYNKKAPKKNSNNEELIKSYEKEKKIYETYQKMEEEKALNLKEAIDGITQSIEVLNKIISENTGEKYKQKMQDFVLKKRSLLEQIEAEKERIRIEKILQERLVITTKLDKQLEETIRFKKKLQLQLDKTLTKPQNTKGNKDKKDQTPKSNKSPINLRRYEQKVIDSITGVHIETLKLKIDNIRKRAAERFLKVNNAEDPYSLKMDKQYEYNALLLWFHLYKENLNTLATIQNQVIEFDQINPVKDTPYKPITIQVD